MKNLQVIGALFFVAGTASVFASAQEKARAKKELRSAHREATMQAKQTGGSSKGVDRHKVSTAGKKLDQARTAMNKPSL